MSRIYSISVGEKKKPLQNKAAKKRLAKLHGDEKKRRKDIKKVFLGLAVIIAVLGLSFVGLKQYAQSCEGDECNPILQPLVNTIDPKLDKTDGQTNVLIFGLDTRDGDSQLMNTDTIILGTLDHESKSVSMTSFPRDLWVTFDLPNGNTASHKINTAYASGEWQQEGKGTETLKNLIEKITGKKIHYYVKVTLKGFVEGVDTIGGIDLTLENDYTDAYPMSELPLEMQATCNSYFYIGGHYCKFTFPAGENHLDGQMALIYARMRIMSPRGDYDRARRQQEVISAAKDNALSSDTLLDPAKLWEMFNIVKDNIETSQFDINDIRAGLLLKDEIDLENINSIVLDPNFGNVPGKYIYVGPGDTGKGYHIVPRDPSFETIRALLDDIAKYPGMYDEAPVLSIYNATGNYTLEKDWALMLDEDNKIIQLKDGNRIIQNIDNKYEGISIYKFTEDDKPVTEDFLKMYFETNIITTDIPDGLAAYGGEHYVIVIGSKDTGTTEVIAQ